MSVCAAPTCSHQSFDGSSYYVDVDVDESTDTILVYLYIYIYMVQCYVCNLVFVMCAVA